MEVRVFGPVEVDDGGRTIALGPRERALLARLSLARGSAVSEESLIDALWGNQPPRTARKTLHGLVHRVRHLLGPEHVQRHAGGYAIGRALVVDLDLVEADTDRARSAAAAGQLIDAAAWYRHALQQVRGEPAPELEDDLSVAGVRRQLVELALSIEEEAISVDLQRGEHLAAIRRSELLVNRDATRERAWALLATAYLQSGRQADALDALARARRALALELGLEPGARLREIEEQILRRHESGEPRAQAPPASSRPGQMKSTLVGRQDEQTRLRAALAALSQPSPTGAVIVVHGDPGVGKSALLSWVRCCATAETTVVSTVGVESEAELSFAGLRDLLGPLSAFTAFLPEPLRAAVESALLLGPARPADRFAVDVGVLELCRAAAARAPLVMLIDDLHWLDRASADVLGFVARRLKDSPVAIIATVRAGGALDALPGAEPIDLQGLGRQPAGQLLQRHGACDGAVVDALVRLTGGNPMALLHASQLLSTRQRMGLDDLPDPLPLDAHLASALRRRIANLPAATHAALVVVAASLNESAHNIDGVLEAMDLDPAALLPAEESGVLALDGDAARFTHPLLRSAVWHGASPRDRRAALRAVAQQEPNAERRAWGLALGAEHRDEQVAVLLEEVGDTARSRMALAAAASAYERAATLGMERAAPGRLIRAADAAIESGMHDRAASLIRTLKASTSDDELVLQADLIQARIDMAVGDPSRALRALEAHARRLEGSEPQRAAVLYANAALASFLPGYVAAAVRLATRARELAGPTDSAVAALAAVTHAAAAVLAGDRRPIRSLDLRSCGAAEGGQRPDERMMIPPSHFLLYGGRYDDARTLLDATIHRQRASGSYQGLAFQLGVRADVAFFEGEWRLGRDYLGQAIDLADATAEHNVLGQLFAVRARFDAYLGHAAAARTSARRALTTADATGASSTRSYAAHALGIACLASNDVRGAIDHLRRSRDICRELGCRNPLVVPFAPDLLEAFARAGEHSEMTGLVDGLDAEHADVPDDWIAGIAARGRGLLGRPAAAVAHLERSVQHLRSQPFRFELARSLLCLGRSERALGHTVRARAALLEADALLQWLGAAPWSAQTRRELEALPRPSAATRP